MSNTVVIIDYGIGNLFSVRRAFEKCGADVKLSSDAATIRSAERVVLPGVGAFADGMRGLIERELDGVVQEYARLGKPLLGICLGMQMLADASEEFGVHDGLGIIPGRVQAIANTSAAGRPLKIPHIGWASLQLPPGRADWSNSILASVRPGDAVYLVHSYGFVPQEPDHRLADVDYGGRTISAAIQRGHVFGCQFHPEKSGAVGLEIVQQFLAFS